MAAKSITDIILLGEGYQAEFKRSIPSKTREISEEVCAFANAAGGVVLIGVSDDNEITGVIIDNRTLSRIQDAINEIKPRIQCEIEAIDVEDTKIISITVPAGSSKPYFLSGSVFMRMGPNTQKLTTPEELHDLFQKTGKIYFDETPADQVYLESISDNLKFFRTLAGVSPAIDDEHLIENLKLTTHEGYLKTGAFLFFSPTPQDLLEHAVIRCVQFDGHTKRSIIDDKKFGGNLYEQFLNTLQWLKSHLNIRYDIEGQGSGPRNELWEIPETVLKEAIVNALAHRDYYEKGSVITVELFDDRLEISNPGGLVSAIPARLFGKRSHSRNPLIFGLFARMRMVEQIGSGIPRMQALMEDAGLPQPVFNTEKTFSVQLYRPVIFEEWVKGWVEKLSKNRLNILHCIHENPKISKREMEAEVGISGSAIDNNIAFLKEIGLLSRQGGAKGGHWIIHYLKPEVGRKGG